MSVDHMNTTKSLSRRFDEINEPPHHRTIESWSKSSKRSKRPRFTHNQEEQSSTIEENLATCLLMLSEHNNNNTTIIKQETSPSTTQNPKKDSYKCGVCNKIFTSHQALGGHKASHRAKPPTATQNYVSAPLNPSGRVHKCSICHRNFPTGQALGGHKRKHYEGIIGNVKSRATTNSSEGRSTTGGSSGVTYSEGGGATSFSPRNFDLNLPPSPELNLMLGF